VGGLHHHYERRAAGHPWLLNQHVSVDVTTRPICDRFDQARFAKALSSLVGFG
jgi:hypothetical protein